MTVKALQVIGDIFTALSAAEHLYFMALETFMWRTRARKVFGTPKDIANITAGLAANQGFYNGILAAGLIWALAEENVNDKAFFLAGVICAGIFGAATANIAIFVVQSVPAILALVFTQFGYKDSDEWSSRHHPLWVILIVFGASLVSTVMGVYVGRRERALKAAAKSGLTTSDSSSTEPAQG